MTQSNMKPVYPAGIFPWADRIDNVNIDFANDINSVVAELESIETTLGTNPQIETNPPTGTSITYPSVSARLSDAMNNNNLPVCSLSATQLTFGNTTIGQLNNYTKNYDPYKMFNGTDVTAPVNGWYTIIAHQTWLWQNNGYSYTTLTLNGSNNVIADHLIDWQFSGNTSTSSGFTPRWQVFGKRNRLANIAWSGLLHKGDRVSVTSENGTAAAQITITNLFLKAACMRTLPINAQFTSG